VSPKKDRRPTWLIRDAEGLSAFERVFLYTVATHSHSVMSRTAEDNCRAMGIGRTKYYEIRNTLLDKGLITERRRYNNGTAYALDWEAVRALVVEDYAAQTPTHEPTPKAASAAAGFEVWADERLERLNQMLTTGSTTWTEHMKRPIADRAAFHRMLRPIWECFDGDPDKATTAWTEVIQPQFMNLAVSADRISFLRSIL
jgi:hypothetical protein